MTNELPKKMIVWNKEKKTGSLSKEHRMKISISLKGKGHPHTEETKRKLREIGKLLIGEKNPFFGRKHSFISKKKISEKLKGKIISEQTRQKIGLANSILMKGNKNAFGSKRTEEIKKKMSFAIRNAYAKKGHYKLAPLTEEHKQKLRKSWLNSNRVSGMTGHNHSEETKKKMSISHIKLLRIGEKSPNWQGGKSFEEYTHLWTDTLRQAIRERDNFKCQECGIKETELIGFQKKLTVHHIDYDKKNCNPNNLITLCCSCHGTMDKNRENWILYFQEKLNSNKYA